jgi:hypothetical protein
MAGRTAFNADFQDLITRYAWGEIWTRPGLEEETRRLIVLAITAALGRWEEFDLHGRAALEAGLKRRSHQGGADADGPLCRCSGGQYGISADEHAHRRGWMGDARRQLCKLRAAWYAFMRSGTSH